MYPDLIPKVANRVLERRELSKADLVAHIHQHRFLRVRI